MFIKVYLPAGVHMFTIEAVNGNKKDMVRTRKPQVVMFSCAYPILHSYSARQNAI